MKDSSAPAKAYPNPINRSESGRYRIWDGPTKKNAIPASKLPKIMVTLRSMRLGTNYTSILEGM